MRNSLSKYASRLLATLAILLPVLAGVFYFLSIAERDHAIRLKDPGEYLWEFKVTETDVNPLVWKSPLFPADSIHQQVLIRCCPEPDDESSILFIDPKNRAPIPPFNNYPLESFNYKGFTLAPDPLGIPEIAIVCASSDPLKSGIIYFRSLNHENLPETRVFAEAGIIGTKGQVPFKKKNAERIILPNFSVDGFDELKICIRAMGDFNDELPGMEILVQNWWRHEDYNEMRTQLRCYNLLMWQECWSLELPTNLATVFNVLEGEEVTGFIFTTDTPNLGNEANGMKDGISSIVHIDTAGNIVKKLENPGRGFKTYTRLSVFAHPGDPDLFILQSQTRLGGNDVDDYIEIRRISDFSVVSRQEIENLEDCVVVPVRNSDRFYIVGSNLCKNPVFYNEKLERVAELPLEEGYTFHSYSYQLRGDSSNVRDPQSGEPLFILFSNGGRLLVVDSDMNLLAAEKLAEGAVYPGPRNSIAVHGPVPIYKHQNRHYWCLNTTSGSFVGYWTKRPKMLRRAVITGIAALFCWLLYYAAILSLRWRFYKRTVDSLYKGSPDAILILNSKYRVRTLNNRFNALLYPRSDSTATSADFKKTLPLPRGQISFEELLQGSSLHALAELILEKSHNSGKIEVMANNRPLSLFYRFDRMRGRFGSYGFVLVLQDITRQLAENRRLIWKFMAQNTAHRLKSPLQRVSFQAESILHRLGTGGELEPDKLKQKAGSILETSAEINMIVREFLDFSDRNVALRPLDLRSFLVKNIQNYRQKNVSEGVFIRLRVAEDLPEIMADDYHLLSMLVNLLDNGLKAIEGDGKLSISAELNHSGTGNPTVQLIVADDGVGIESEILPRIFEHHESFFRDGHGIGLAVVQSVVDSHNGRIRVESQKGMGTKFLVDLPVRA